MSFNENSKLKDILANEEAKAILEKYVPGASTHPQLAMIKNFTLKVISGFPQAGIKPEAFDSLISDLSKLD
ncbi:MAG: hypothetical protein ACOY46_15115 [Bacillota bacterium]